LLFVVFGFEIPEIAPRSAPQLQTTNYKLQTDDVEGILGQNKIFTVAVEDKLDTFLSLADRLFILPSGTTF
jgi:hypothetical protein